MVHMFLHGCPFTTIHGACFLGRDITVLAYRIHSNYIHTPMYNTLYVPNPYSVAFRAHGQALCFRPQKNPLHCRSDPYIYHFFYIFHIITTTPSSPREIFSTPLCPSPYRARQDKINRYHTRGARRCLDKRLLFLRSPLSMSSLSSSLSSSSSTSNSDTSSDEDVKLPAKRPAVSTRRGARKASPASNKQQRVARLETPDWDSIASSEFGQTPLMQNLSHMELDALIGWATHVSAPQPADNINPLLDLPNSPMRPGELRIIHNAMKDFIQNSPIDNFTRLHREFDQSALVSLGICLEEMMTASLLPLAQAHVRRCRTLKNEDLETDVTLPPEEAILRLRKQDLEGIDMALPTSLPATHAQSTEVEGPPSQASSQEDMKQVLRNWQQTHNINPEFFEMNRELYAFLVGRRVLERSRQCETEPTPESPAAASGSMTNPYSGI